MVQNTYNIDCDSLYVLVLQLYLAFCRDNNIDEIDMEMFFCTDQEILGKISTHELKPGGAEIPVTEENKEEYLRWESGHV